MSDQTHVAGRLQQTVPSGLVLLLAIWITVASFNVDDPGPYLFPRIIAVAMLVLALISFQRAFRGKSRTGVGLDLEVLRNLAPGVAIMLVYVVFAAEFLGFYLGSFVAFLMLYALYDPQGHGEAQSWVRRVIISAGFIPVMYLLFALVLKVQTPRGILL